MYINVETNNFGETVVHLWDTSIWYSSNQIVAVKFQDKYFVDYDLFPVDTDSTKRLVYTDQFGLESMVGNL